MYFLEEYYIAASRNLMYAAGSIKRCGTKPKDALSCPSGVSRSAVIPPKSVSNLDKFIFSPPSFQ